MASSYAARGKRAQEVSAPSRWKSVAIDRPKTLLPPHIFPATKGLKVQDPWEPGTFQRLAEREIARIRVGDVEAYCGERCFSEEFRWVSIEALADNQFARVPLEKAAETVAAYLVREGFSAAAALILQNPAEVGYVGVNCAAVAFTVERGARRLVTVEGRSERPKLSVTV